MKKVELKVCGMHCEGCEKRIENGLKAIEGVEEVKANHKKESVFLSLSKDVLDEVKDKLVELDFEVK